MIKVYDNFLPSHEFAVIHDIIMSGNFPWYYSKTKVSTHYPENPNNYQFTHMVYDNYVPRSEMWQTLDPIIRRINAQSWLRTKCNLTNKTEEPYIYGLHVDIDDFEGKTAVFYINENNGNTLFKTADGDKYFEAKPNRLVVFDAQIEHTGISCTDSKVRCVINLNFFPNPSFNLNKEDLKRIKVTEL